MSGISLTASMRSNLLSLQNIAGQQDIVQNRLATGLKVSSAIDNPSSYYTASSLNNRAADLTALLDSMSQGIQTIKAASEAIESGTKFLEQAKAVANQALETAIPAKEWFVEQVGENGVVVETAQELLDAVNANKETIVVYGKIELKNQNITLKQGQKLVGTEYFTNSLHRNVDGDRFSQIDMSNTDINTDTGLVLSENTVLADLDLKFEICGDKIQAGIAIRQNNNYIKNINLEATASNRKSQLSGIYMPPNCDLTLSGTINIDIDTLDFAIYNYGGKLDIYADSKLNLSAAECGIINYGETSISSKCILNIKAKTTFLNGFNDQNIINDCILNIANGVRIYAKSQSLFRNNRGLNNTKHSINISKGVDVSLNNTVSKYQGSWKTQNSLSFSNYIFADEKTLNDNKNFLQQNYRFISFVNKTSNKEASEKQYILIISQYNTLISDSFYKGVNLLSGQNLKINFNEDCSSKMDVTGVKADSDSLGLRNKEWKTAEDVEKSISELEEAINTLRGFASQFGNYYSIVTTRQDFTENLINVLEEGADKLTLADMNQESANMLALQTSQQLAVNSLSLASQAAQSILKLF